MIRKMRSCILIFFAMLYLSSPMCPTAGDDAFTYTEIHYTGIVEFIDLFAEPAEYLDTSEYAVGQELAEIRRKAEEITRGHSGVYEKVRAVTMYIADSTYYDYQFLEGIMYRSQKPYDVLISKIAVCQGYSDLATVMLRSIGIPCMTATSDTHAYNFAYDGSSWVFFDPTWCSANVLTAEGELVYSGCHEKYFDLTSVEIEALGDSHRTNAVKCGSIAAVLDWNRRVAVITDEREGVMV